jgi:hypothetical protein
MLSVSKYPKAYIDDCRRKIDVQLAAFRKLEAAPSSQRSSRSSSTTWF